MGYIRAREVLKKVYPNSKSWPAKVDKMTDAQVVAVYFRMFQEGKL